MRTGRRGFRRVAALVCSLALCASMMPAAALAEEPLPAAAVTVQQGTNEQQGSGDVVTGTESKQAAPEGEGENGNTPEDPSASSSQESGTPQSGDEEKAPENGGGDEEQTGDGANTPADGTGDENSNVTGDENSNGPGDENTLPGTGKPETSGESDPTTGENAPTAPQAGGDVARIVDGGSYDTLDAAIAAAEDGAIIELLADATTDGMNLSKTLVIRAAEGLAQKPTITFKKYGIALWGKALTFKNCDVVMEGIGSTPYTAEWNWVTICASKDASLTLDNVTMTMDAEKTTNSPHAIYFCNNNVLNLYNGTVLTIKNYANDALEWDGGNGGYNVNIINSTFVSDHNRSGFTGTFYATIENSDVDVINSTGNGSNGSHFIIKNSTVDFNNNGSHGLSAGTLLIKDHSTVICRGNGYYGAYASSEFLVDGTSTLTVTHNSKAGDFAGLKITSGVTDGSVEAGAVVTITDNYCSGLSNNGKLTFEEGASLTITGNDNDKGTSTYGGGIYNSGASAVLVLPSDAVIYNNHSQNPNNGRDAGDDIFNNTTATITFGKVGSNWNLDDCKNDEGNTVEGCTAGGVIDGWYDDSANEVSEDGAVTSYNRWNAHDGDGIYHVEKYSTFTDGVTTVSGTLSLKAAHGASATLQPADITIYMGGQDGYDGVLGNGEAQSSNSLPTPGFYFTLPADLNQVLSNALGKDPTTAIDLSGLVTVTATGDDGKARTWKLERYGVAGGSSTAIVDEASGLERFIYKIVPMETGQAPVRVQFTDKETGWTATSDNFTPDTALHNEYTMELYTGGVNPNSITMEFTLPEEKGGQTYTCGYDQENSKSGTLTVRYANNDALIIDAVEDMDAAIANEDEMFYVEADSDQPFFINEQDTAGTGEDTHKTGVEVDFTDVSLLADDIITQERADALYDRAEQAAESAGLENVNMFAKYFDLVDKENGNAWLTPADGETVTVYWPYPAGTDKNTEFKLYHFEGLDREMQVEDVEQEVYDAEMEDMKITKGETGITFETGSFSPFVLAWENPAEQPSGGSGSEENPAPTATPQPTPAPAEAETVAAPAAAAVPQTGDDMPVALLGVSAAGAAVVFVALLAVRKRRHGQD